MKKAIYTRTNIEVYIREDLTPKHYWNTGKVCVSKQPTGMAYFSVDKEQLKEI